ncbi:MAG: hypothetical protein ACTSPB_22550, partial [Candidatus Thorarchaeota archaeon]
MISNNQEDVLISLEEIQEVLRNIDKTEKVAEFGLKSYHRMMRSESTTYDRLIRTLARILHKAFKDIEEDQINEIGDCIEGKGQFIEPAWADWPYEWANAHNAVHRMGKMGIKLTLIELLLMA